jgi:hypothetical protein
MKTVQTRRSAHRAGKRREVVRSVWAPYVCPVICFASGGEPVCRTIRGATRTCAAATTGLGAAVDRRAVWGGEPIARVAVRHDMEASVAIEVEERICRA